MRAAVNAIVLLGAALAVLATLPVVPAGAEEGGRSQQEGADLWVPSLAVISGVTVQNWNAAVESEICRGCSIPDSLMREETLRDPATGGDRDVTPYVGGSLELMTPELSIRGSPRLFVAGEIAAAFGTDRPLAQEGEPGEIKSPIPGAAADFIGFSEDAALGQGSKTSATFGSIIYGANAGVSFPFEMYGRALRIKPSFAWMRYKVEVDGLVVDAECLPSGFGGNECNPSLNGFLREIRLQGSGSRSFDGIGPGLDVELDTGRFGPIGSSIFAGFRVYYVLGDRTIEFSDTQSYDDQLGVDETHAQWSFEADPWMYRVGLGMRFQWLGSAD